MFTTTKDADAKLVEMVSSLEDEASSWMAVQYRFNRLQEHYSSDYQIKIAVNLINDLLKNNQGGVFVLDDFSIYLLIKDATESQLSKVTFQLRYLFADDPLAYDMEGDENPEFCEVYDLSAGYEEFLDLVRRRIIKRVQQRRKGEKDTPAPKKKKAAAASKSGQVRPLTPSRLSTIEKELVTADLSRVMRRQPVCAAVPNMMIRRVFDEFYINITHLRQLVDPNTDLLSDRWLFKYLTKLLDERMLEMLGKNAKRHIDRPISLNLNIESLLSESFQRFDEAIKPSMKVSIVIEIQIADIFSDMAAFKVAREMVQKLGYRVCLDGVTNLSFTQIDREKLGFDLAKLQWNADLDSELKTRENKQLAEAVKKCGPNRIILCRCDSREAVDYGQALGISLFQGRFLDKIIDPTAKVEN
jgi:hypothetical protein